MQYKRPSPAGASRCTPAGDGLFIRSAKYGKVPAALGYDVHFDLAVSQRLVIYVQLVVYLHSDLIVLHADLHVSCIDSNEHLPIWGLVICKVLLIFFKDHMGAGQTALHDLHRIGPCDLDLVPDRTRHPFKHFIIDDIVLSVPAVIICRGNDFNLIIPGLIPLSRVIHDINVFS